MPQKENKKSNFRDNIATVDSQGSRVWLYPQKPKGALYKWRTLLSYVLIGFLFGAPFIELNSHPILQFNVLERKFYIFGLTFWPQDFHLFGLALITFIVFIILFTAIFGRIFCGWICPQTIFMELVFRKIEYLIEGSSQQQQKLNNSNWNVEKLFKKGLKHSVFYAISFIIGNVFLAYIIGKDQLYSIISSPPSEHMIGFITMVIFSLIFYLVFSWLREQVCVMVCPYGRLQGVLLDKNSIVVHYDFNRGEPRGKGKRKENTTLGSCVDCFKCVDVCPTGIDIRNGTQLECVNCTACIDACNIIMDKTKQPRGLIKYSSYNMIKNGFSKLFTIRVKAYSVVLSMLFLLIVGLFSNRTIIESTILKTPGKLFYKLDNGKIRNLYNIKVVNKSYDDLKINLKLINPIESEISLIQDLTVNGDDMNQSAFFIDLPNENLQNGRTPIHIAVLSNGEVVENIKSSFIGPVLNEK